MKNVKFEKIEKGEYSVFIHGIYVGDVYRDSNKWYIARSEESKKYITKPSCTSISAGGWSNWNQNRLSAVYEYFTILIEKGPKFFEEEEGPTRKRKRNIKTQDLSFRLNIYKNGEFVEESYFIGDKREFFAIVELVGKMDICRLVNIALFYSFFESSRDNRCNFCKKLRAPITTTIRNRQYKHIDRGLNFGGYEALKFVKRTDISKDLFNAWFACRIYTTKHGITLVNNGFDYGNKIPEYISKEAKRALGTIGGRKTVKFIVVVKEFYEVEIGENEEVTEGNFFEYLDDAKQTNCITEHFEID